MRTTLHAMLLALALALLISTAPAQDPAPSAKPADFFSGTVVSCTPTAVTVNRKTLTRDQVTKTFVIDGDTKVEGVLKPKAHVTVRFAVQDNATRAIHIIVR